MADVNVTINVEGGQETVPIRRCGGFIDYKPKPAKLHKYNKVDDTLVKNIRIECLALRNYTKLGLDADAEATKVGIVNMVMMLTDDAEEKYADNR